MFISPLYVPADRPAMLEKAAGRGSDLVIIDLEDAVPLSSKSDARKAAVVAAARLAGEGQAVGIRINSVPDERDADLEALAESRLDAVMVPKATAREIEFVAKSDAIEGVPLVALIESGEGLLDAREIAAHRRVTRLAVGEADLAADLDMEAGDDDPAWLASRMRLVWASAAAGLDGPIGPVFIDLRDLDGFRASTVRLKAMGFGGRSAIHPAQVTVINEVFTPGDEELAAAGALVERYDAALAAGRGVIVDESGSIVDEALVRRARRMVEGS